MSAHATWPQLVAALEFAVAQFDRWRDERRLRPEQATLILEGYAALRRDWLAAAAHFEPIPAEWAKAYVPPEFPDEAAAVRERQLEFLAREIERHEAAGRITLAQSHDFLTEMRERLAFVRRKLAEREADPVLEARPAPAPARPFLEVLLDPRSIQWMLAVGGGLMVVGLVIYLYTVGIFENPLVVAGVLGGVNLLALAAGGHLLARTRFQLAGKALTLLACLVLPLNLWFVSAQYLVTADTLVPQSPGYELLQAAWQKSVAASAAEPLMRAGNGNLWFPALVICLLYAGAAWLLKDATFVPVFVGGATLAVLLALAKQGHFWEIAAPSSVLVAVGLVALHLERAFPPGKGPFRREAFGVAFFFSGMALLVAGLGLLLAAQVVGDWLYDPFFKPIYEQFESDRPWIVSTPEGLRLAALLVIAGVYACVYADVVVRRVGVYVFFAALGVLWAEALVVESLDLNVGAELVLATLSLTALAVNLYQIANSGPTGRGPRYLPALAAVLAFVPVIAGVLMHLVALLAGRGGYNETGWFVGAMALSAVACRVGASLNAADRPRLAEAFLFGAGASLLVGVAALLNVLGLRTWAERATLVMLVPVVYLAAAHLRAGTSLATALRRAAHTGAAVMLVASLYSTLEVAADNLVNPRSGERLNLLLAAFFTEAALFYLLAASLFHQRIGVYMGTVTACAAAWQVLQYLRVPAEYYTAAFAALGLALLLVYRLTPRAEGGPLGVAGASFASGNGLLTVAAVACGLIVLTALAANFSDGVRFNWRVLANCAVVAALTATAAAVVRDEVWRRWYIVLSVLEGLLGVLALGQLIDLQPWQKAEIFLLVAGVVVLVLSLAGQQREQEGHSDLVSFGLLLGSALLALPLAAATAHWRGYWLEFHWPDELGLLVVGLALLLGGNALRLKSPTLVGIMLLAWNLLTLPLFGRKLLEKLPTVGLVLAIGGAVIFGGGLLLALSRDYLLALPDRVKQRRGLFRVLSWR